MKRMKVFSALLSLLLAASMILALVPAAVQAHPKFQENSDWKYKLNILPQQEGFGLTLE